MTLITEAATYAAANPGMTRKDAMRAALDSADRYRAAEQAAAQMRYAQGTGVKSLARYQANLAERGRLTRREQAAVRRAVELGKAVPADLLAAL